MTTIILQVIWVVPLMGCAARRAATGHLLRVSGRATQRARAAAQARPVGSVVPGMAHGSSGRVILGPGQISRATC
jgi:hypothetical protein